MSKNLVIIPARGGSKGIPRKNLYKVNGKPLIDYTLDVARDLLNEKIVDYIHVSTDDQEIADHVINYGFEILFMRPAELATDYSKTPDALVHSIKILEEHDYQFDNIIILQPTSPLRDYNNIKKAISNFENSLSDSLISVVNEEHYSLMNCYLLEGELGNPIDPNHNKGLMRQEILPLYFRNGSIYIVKSQYLLSNNKMISDKPILFEMSRRESINIDSLIDIKLFEFFGEKDD